MFAPSTSIHAGSLHEHHHQQQLSRHHSMSWRSEIGLPPPPSEIDHYHNLQESLIPSITTHRAFPPSSYDLQFGGQEEVTDSMSMNTVTKHPKLKLKIILENALFEAGGSILGSLEILSSTSQRLRLGEIAIELEAFEELTSRDHSATQIFLFNRTLFQGEHLPPSNAVLPAAPVLGHWTARKGRTTFPFSFKLPSTAPSSINFAGNAHLRYILKGSVQTWWNDTKSIVIARSDALVVEKWHDELDPRFLEPIEAVADTQIFMGGSGAVWLEAVVMKQLFAAGGIVLIRAGVKNNTKRHISGIKVCIARRLVFPVSSLPGVPAQRQSLEPQITEVVHSQIFKGSSFEFPPNEEVVVNLPVDLPRDLRTIRKTRLFEVQIVAQVSAHMGNFAKDLTVEIPIYVAHSCSLQRTVDGPLEPLRKLPQRSRSAMSQHGYHDLHPTPSPAIGFDPHMIPLEAYNANRGWSPAPLFSGVSMGPPSRPSSAAPVVEAAAHNSKYSPSPEQFAFVPGRLGQEPQVLWDSHSIDWNAQALLQQMRSAPAHTLNLESNQHTPSIDRQPSAQQIEHAALQQSQMPQSPPLDAAPHQSGISVSQLLSLGAIPVPGLATIEEDSESTAGTVRSLRTLVGSVGRNDIAHFEAMVDRAQEEEEEQEQEQSQSIEDLPFEKMLPEPQGISAIGSASIKRPRESDVLDVPTVAASELPLVVALANVAPAEPNPQAQEQHYLIAGISRPASAQGRGLSALESRLASQRHDPVTLTIVKESNTAQSSMQKVTSASRVSSEQKECVSGGLRAAAAIAMDRQRKARQESGESELRQQKLIAHAKKEREEKQRQQEQVRLKLEESKIDRDRRMEAQRAEYVPLQADKERGEQKTIDVQEQKKLNKEAVGRIAGWLSSSPNASRGVGEEQGADLALSPSTPSPSVYEQERDDEKESTTFTKEGLGKIGTVDHLPPILSADLRALIDSNDARSAPKQGTAIHRHIGSRRFSGKGITTTDDVQSLPAAKQIVPSAASRGIPSSRTTVSQLERIHPQKSQTADEGDDEVQKYDSRSARGGKGGRVASVANLWASIADGTDGSNDRFNEAPILTLKPKALRSGATGFSAFDFTKSKTDESKKLSAMNIFVSPTLGSNDTIRSPPLKTKKAATFINTTSPKPVFVKAPLPLILNLKESSATKIISTEKDETVLLSGQMKQSRKLASDLIAKEAAKLKTGRDLLVESDADLMLHLPMNGRGTTKPIGRNKLEDLRSLWGS